MIEFYLRPENGIPAETTLIGFSDVTAILFYVKKVGEVKIHYNDDESLPTLTVPNG